MAWTSYEFFMLSVCMPATGSIRKNKVILPRQDDLGVTRTLKDK
ncbi:MAG: hypothetical protein Q8927_12450 [Bacteroidota bacterium]|nr:hypothetical protein [Bacteroidota bacterium]MDP4217004.1 hypothetical protein [Bacteroidota bacterium]MDP4245825.1 hypothetical protein [Bacteroidota bacterium]MDP4255884.1 hypothetical protein [Bacteroidota bacterium]MDP4256668.1 hypothetical protein [Bacteroidota bacterium]